MSTTQNEDFLQWAYEKFQAADYEEASTIIGYVRELGFDDDARSMEIELVESVKNNQEDEQQKRDIIQGNWRGLNE